MDKFKALLECGQSIWLDYIQRSLISSGELKGMVDKGLRGLTSNPSIFQSAIANSSDYDSVISEILKAEPSISTQDLYERIAIEDIRNAADILRPAYEESNGADGFVSFEVSPHLAYDTDSTISEARRLWDAISRPNLMIKVPATPQGVLATEALIAEGINVNATLMFSTDHYEGVAHAYIRGLERNPSPVATASVASFFVSRVDTSVDAALEDIGTPEALALHGKAAVANAKMAYRRFTEIFYGREFDDLREKGATVQRVLWGSTSTKNPTYSDVLYVDELIGRDTVNTVPPATLKAFLDHGQVRPTLLEGLDKAERDLAHMRKLGIDVDAVTEQLQKDGVVAFATAYDGLLASLEQKRSSLILRV